MGKGNRYINMGAESNYIKNIKGNYYQQKTTTNTSFQDSNGNTISSEETFRNDNGDISTSSSTTVNGQSMQNKIMAALNTLAEAAGGKGLPPGVAEGLQQLFGSKNINSNTNSQTVIGDNNQAIQQSNSVYHQSGNFGIGHMSGGSLREDVEIGGERIIVKDNVLRGKNQQIIIGTSNQQTVVGNNNQAYQSSINKRQSMLTDVKIGGDLYIGGDISQNYEEVEEPIISKKELAEKLKRQAVALLREAEIAEREAEEALEDYWD